MLRQQFRARPRQTPGLVRPRRGRQAGVSLRWFILAILKSLLIMGATSAVASQPAKQPVRIRPGFTDKQQVGFMLLDADGKAHRITNDPHGSTNTVVLSIDNVIHTFGFDSGTLGKPQSLDQ